MEWSFERQMERRGAWRPAALEEMHGELGPGGLERKAQARRRRFGRRRARAVEEGDGAAGFGRYRQALQIGVARLRQPGRECMASPRAQRLLCGPKGFPPIPGDDQ